jgi:trimeric autotransporter adhesin
VSLRRQFRSGLSFRGSYTYSKSIDDAASVGGAGSVVAQNYLDVEAERSLSVFNRTHQFLLNYNYELPFGDRKPFLNHGGALARAFGNWQISGVTTLESGTPYTARVLGNTGSSGGTGAYFSLRADATGLPVPLPSSDRTALEYFNTAAFTLPPTGQLGNAGRNTIQGPPMYNFNVSLDRQMTFSRERGITGDFRIQADNIFNTPNFMTLATVVNATNFGRVTSVNTMRTIAFSLRFRF